MLKIWEASNFTKHVVPDDLNKVVNVMVELHKRYFRTDDVDRIVSTQWAAGFILEDVAYPRNGPPTFGAHGRCATSRDLAELGALKLSRASGTRLPPSP